MWYVIKTACGENGYHTNLLNLESLFDSGQADQLIVLISKNDAIITTSQTRKQIMNPAIGKLSSGKFYAYLNGYKNEPTYADTTEELEILLAGGTPVPVAVVKPVGKSRVKLYSVKAKLTTPSCFNAGYEMSIVATTKPEAISRARTKVRGLGHTRQDGGLTYTATEIHGD